MHCIERLSGHISHRTRRHRLGGWCAFWALTAAPAVAQAQPTPAIADSPVTFDGRGVTVRGTDGITALTVRFRVQQLYSVSAADASGLEVTRTQFAIRRMRLRFAGTIRDPRLRVNVQLSFARSDLDQENTGIANVLRDANVSWQFTPQFAATIGQGKLPGNRQRQVSSADLQSPERSPVNALFTVDRDVGLFLAYARDLGRARVVWRGALSSGEGRNPATGDGGVAVTSRVDFLPFGAFTNGGDYIEGDQAREPSLKLSLGGAVSRNDRAIRTGGQLGPLLAAPQGMTTYFADALLKRRGVAVAAEYAHRVSPFPVLPVATATRFVYAGQGLSVQASWLLPRSSWEPMLRVTTVTPALAIQSLARVESLAEQSVGLTRYVQGHRVKINTELLHSRFSQRPLGMHRSEWTLRMGTEVGI